MLAKLAMTALLVTATMLDTGCCDKKNKDGNTASKPAPLTKKPAQPAAQELASGQVLTQQALNDQGQLANVVNGTAIDPAALAQAESPTQLAPNPAAANQAFDRMSDEWRQADASTDPEQQRLHEGAGAYYQGIGQTNTWPGEMSIAEAEQGIEEWSRKYRSATTQQDRIVAFNRMKYYQGVLDTLTPLPVRHGS